MNLPSNFANGSSTGTEPVARITLAAAIVCRVPSGAVISTWRPASSRPLPKYDAILFALNRSATPAVNCLTILSLRPTMALTSMAGLATRMP